MLANLNVPLYLDKNRPSAIQNLVNENDCDVIYLMMVYNTIKCIEILKL